MYLPSKEEFEKELSTIQNEESKEKLTKIYNHLTGTKKIRNIKSVCKELIKELFKTEFSTDVNIPYRFLNSNLGSIVFTALYCKSIEKYYNATEVVELTKTLENPKGFSRQFIVMEANSGNLKGTKKGSWVFEETDVNEWLIKKNITPIE